MTARPAPNDPAAAALKVPGKRLPVEQWTECEVEEEGIITVDKRLRWLSFKLVNKFLGALFNEVVPFNRETFWGCSPNLVFCEYVFVAQRSNKNKNKIIETFNL